MITIKELYEIKKVLDTQSNNEDSDTTFIRIIENLAINLENEK